MGFSKMKHQEVNIISTFCRNLKYDSYCSGSNHDDQGMINFLGWVDNCGSLLRQSAVLATPTINESFPALFTNG